MWSLTKAQRFFIPLSVGLFLAVTAYLVIFRRVSSDAGAWPHLEYTGIHYAYNPTPRHNVSLTPCRGPRGLLLSEGNDDTFPAYRLKLPDPKPQFGSSKELGLDGLWITAADRYGPYGYKEDEKGYKRSRVDWNSIDWATLQDDCLAQNRARFASSQRLLNVSTIAGQRALELRSSSNEAEKQPRDPKLTGRTAIVLRLWSTYKWTPAAIQHIRALIVELGLGSGGEYAVFILVDFKDEKKGIFKDRNAYEEALKQSVPPEFRSMTVLFDLNLQRSWYEKVDEFAPLWQIMQPVQLFAHFIDGFDHYWNLEVDVRYTGNALQYIDAISTFARNEPRKQSRERSSFYYMPEVHGSYHDLQLAVNKSLKGAGAWGPNRIEEVHPAGPMPPVETPQEDNFEWGVGEDADVLVTLPCHDVLKLENWWARDFARGFYAETDPQRIRCPPAISRGSWNLLNSVHTSQSQLGLAVPGEATLPSWALWNGMKISHPPQPWYLSKPLSPAKADEYYNGGPQIPDNGISNGDLVYKNNMMHLAETSSWWWFSPFARRIMNQWLQNPRKIKEKKLIYLLRKHKGQIWAPVMALHPVKPQNH